MTDEPKYFRVGPDGITPLDELPADTVFTCVSVAMLSEANTVPGSEQRTCADCQTAVWMSPPIVAAVARHPQFPIVCIDCSLARMGGTH